VTNKMVEENSGIMGKIANEAGCVTSAETGAACRNDLAIETTSPVSSGAIMSVWVRWSGEGACNGAERKPSAPGSVEANGDRV